MFQLVDSWTVSNQVTPNHVTTNHVTTLTSRIISVLSRELFPYESSWPSPWLPIMPKASLAL